MKLRIHQHCWEYDALGFMTRQKQQICVLNVMIHAFITVGSK